MPNMAGIFSPRQAGRGIGPDRVIGLLQAIRPGVPVKVMSADECKAAASRMEQAGELQWREDKASSLGSIAVIAEMTLG
ncbi:MAG: hypothetical protein WCO52_01540 [bacterium]